MLKKMTEEKVFLFRIHKGKQINGLFFLGKKDLEDPLEKEMETHSSILA